MKHLALSAFVLASLLLAGAARPARAESAVPAIMNLLKSGRLPAARVGTVLELVCKQGNAEDLGYVFEQALQPDAFDAATRVDALNYLARATQSRKVKPQGDVARLAQLIRPDAPPEEAELQRAAIRLCGLWQVEPAAKPLRQMALEPRLDFGMRRAAIESLTDIGGEAARSTLDQLAGAEHPLPLRYLAVAGMTQLDLDRATRLAIGALQETTDRDDPAPMFAAFLGRKSGPDKLAAGIAQAKIPPDAAKLGLRYMYAVGRGDAALSAALAKAAGFDGKVKPLTAQEVKQLIDEVLAEGNARRGEEVFRRADVSCMKCHSVSKAGGDVGPDLSAIGSSSPIDYVVKSILFPNQSIKEQFQAAVVITIAGQVYTGIVKDRNAERIVLKEATGRERIIAVEDIEEEVEGKSLMPQGLTRFLTHRELVDLVRFLSELGKPGPYVIRSTPTVQRWRVLQAVPEELTAAVPPDVLFRQALLENESLAWKPAYGKVAGVLPLDELTLGSGTAVLYLRAAVDVTEPGRVRFQFDSADGLAVWVDDEAFEPAPTIETNLPRGRHRLTLRVDAAGRRSNELKVEVLKADDSTIEFTVVGGR